jgi:hypothetical protein
LAEESTSRQYRDGRRLSREAGRLSAQVRLVVQVAAESGEDIPAEVTGALLTIDRWARDHAAPPQQH